MAVIWNRDCEFMPRDEIEQMKLERLQSTVNRAYKNVPAYRKKFKSAGFEPEDVTELAHLSKLPFTTKQDLIDNYPYNMFAVPLREIVRVHSSPGMTSKPIVVGYTVNDLHIWSEIIARSLAAAGVTKDDIVQIAYGHGMFTGAFGFQYGAELLGATVVPVSVGDIEKHILVMKDYKVSVLVGLPSFAVQIGEKFRDFDISPNELSLRIGVFGAEPWSESLRKRIEERLYIKANDNYGVIEIMGPGIAAECEYQDGLHIWEDHFVPEIVDPMTGKVVEDGKEGELVLTTLTKEAFPLIRYRTGDIASLTREPCRCGRTMARMSRVSGRSDDVVVIRGIQVFPAEIESILLNIEGTEPHYLIMVNKPGGEAELEIWVEIEERIFGDKIKRIQQLEDEIRKAIEARIGFAVKVKMVEPRSLARSLDKQKRVIDRRRE